MPSSTTGREGLFVASLGPYIDLKAPSKTRMRALKTMKLRFYNRKIHRTAFAIPQFILDALQIRSDDQQQHATELWMAAFKLRLPKYIFL